MIIHLKIIGILLMLLALIHIIFPKYFNWKTELQHLSLMNRQMMTVHTFFIALTVFLMGLLCVTSAADLVETNLGRKISLGLGAFWTIRLFCQLFIYSPKLWKGKTMETTVHILFTGLWIYLSAIFLLIYFN
jgi:hypothetical protein